MTVLFTPCKTSRHDTLRHNARRVRVRMQPNMFRTEAATDTALAKQPRGSILSRTCIPTCVVSRAFAPEARHAMAICRAAVSITRKGKHMRMPARPCMDARTSNDNHAHFRALCRNNLEVWVLGQLLWQKHLRPVGLLDGDRRHQTYRLHLHRLAVDNLRARWTFKCGTHILPIPQTHQTSGISTQPAIIETLPLTEITSTAVQQNSL